MVSPEAIENYRDATRRMRIGAMTFTCSVCRQHKSCIGRTVCGGIRMYRRQYRCAQCTGDARQVAQLLQAWAQLEFAISQRKRDTSVTSEIIEAVSDLLKLKKND